MLIGHPPKKMRTKVTCASHREQHFAAVPVVAGIDVKRQLSVG
jgi:hypothetical protein